MAPFTLHRHETLALREHDKVLFSSTDKANGVAALDQARVTHFDKDSITLYIGEEERTFARSDPALQSLTHAYAITSHASQGKTAQDVIAVVDSSERMLTSQVGFYVSVSRSADTLALIVDDKEKVTEALYRNTGLKSSALDAAERIEAMTGLDQDPVTAPENGQHSSVERETETSKTVEHDDGVGKDAPIPEEDSTPIPEQDISL